MSDARLQIIQALFDTQPFMAAMNWPVSVSRFVESIGELRRLCRNTDSAPDEIAEQWRKATAAVGVSVMAALFEERGEWQPLIYETAADRKAWREHDDFTVVWEQPAGCVIVTLQKTGDVVDAVLFETRKEV